MDISLLEPFEITNQFKRGVTKNLDSILEASSFQVLTPSDVLRYLRRFSGLHAYEFERVFGLALGTVKKIELGDEILCQKRQAVICRYLGLPSNTFTITDPAELRNTLKTWASTAEVKPVIDNRILELGKIHSILEQNRKHRQGLMEALEYGKSIYPHLTLHDILSFKTLLEVMSLE